MIEQFGKDVEHIEQTTVAESSKLFMQLMALMRQKLQKSQLSVDFEKDKPAQLKIDVDGQTIYQETEQKQKLKSSSEINQKTDSPIAQKDLKKIIDLLDLPQGEKINLPYQNISIKVNEQEIFKVENGQVVFNALVQKATEQTKIKSDKITPIPTPESVPIERNGTQITQDAINHKSLTRQEQLSKMTTDLKSLEVIDSLEQIVEEIGKTKEDQKVLHHDHYFLRKGEDGFSIYDKTQKKNVFYREVKIARSNLSNEDLQKLKEFTQQYEQDKQDKENSSLNKDEIEID